MEVDQLDPVELVRGAQLLDRGHEIGGVEPELRLFAATLLPTPETAGRELDANARRRLHLQLVRDLQQNVDLAQLFDDHEHLMAELLSHEGEAHELLVLVAVAHDEMIRVLCQPQHRLQLGLTAALESDAVLRAELHDLFDDVALLVHLDRIHGGVAALVAELLARMRKAIGQRVQAGAQDVREAQEDRELDPLLLEIVRELVQVQLPIRMIGVRPDDYVTALVDVEEPGAPAVDVVERLRGLDGPASRRVGRYGFCVRRHQDETKGLGSSSNGGKGKRRNGKWVGYGIWDPGRGLPF